MVKAVFRTDGLSVNGHALFAEHGKDIVCAGISSVIIGALNAFDENDIQVEMSSGSVELKILNQSERNQTILYTIKTQLKTIEQTHNRNIKVTEEK